MSKLSPRISGHVSDLELQIDRAIAKKDVAAAETLLYALAETRPAAAIVQAHRWSLRSDDAAAIAVRSALIDDHARNHPAGAVIAAELCRLTSPEGTNSDLEATAQRKILVSRLERDKFFAAAWALKITFGLSELQQTLVERFDLDTTGFARMAGNPCLGAAALALFDPIVPVPADDPKNFSNPLAGAATNSVRQVSSEANHVIAAFLGVEDGPQDVQAQRTLREMMPAVPATPRAGELRVQG